MAAPAGFGWLALQADDFGNAPRIPNFVEAVRFQGLAAGVWQTMPVVQDWTGLDFYIAELERRINTAAFAQQFRTWNPELPAAFITNLDLHDDPDYFLPLVEAGFFCFTEAYLSDNPTATPWNMQARASNQGIPESYPGPSLYRGVNGHPTLDTYDLAHWPTWAGYLAEYIL